jgi:methyl-accepting chemotaxis protein
MAETLEISSKMYRLLDELERIHGQTNLLSLNASVEAARTGQSNNGFGVVAQELRSLSNRSENAAVSLRKLTEELDTHSHVVQGGLEHVIKICLLNSTSVQTDINALLKSICLVGEHTSESVKELTRLTECVGTDIGSVITALQFQDLLRQRLEHVANPLRLLSTPAISINSSQSPEVPSPKEIRTKSAVNDINRQPIKAAENTIVRKAGMAPTLQIVSFERKAEEEDNITLF